MSRAWAALRDSAPTPSPCPCSGSLSLACLGASLSIIHQKSDPGMSKARCLLASVPPCFGFMFAFDSGIYQI